MSRTLLCWVLFVYVECNLCEFSLPNGKVIDFSALIRTIGEDDWAARDKHNNLFYFNVCEDTVRIPEECHNIDKAMRSPAYLVRNGQRLHTGADCVVLGDSYHPLWALIDDSDVSEGMSLTYENGEACPRDPMRRASFRIEFHCEEGVQDGDPDQYLVYYSQSDCMYTVYWPTALACVRTQLSAGWTFIACLIFFTGLYVSVGCTHNLVRRRLTFGCDAFPHSLFWRHLPELVKDGIAYSFSLLGRASPFVTYGRVPSTDYEWGEHA